MRNCAPHSGIAQNRVLRWPGAKGDVPNLPLCFYNYLFAQVRGLRNFAASLLFVESGRFGTSGPSQVLPPGSKGGRRAQMTGCGRPWGEAGETYGEFCHCRSKCAVARGLEYCCRELRVSVMGVCGARAWGFLARLNAIALGGDLSHSGNTARRKCCAAEMLGGRGTALRKRCTAETLRCEVLCGGDAGQRTSRCRGGRLQGNSWSRRENGEQ